MATTHLSATVSQHSRRMTTAPLYAKRFSPPQEEARPAGGPHPDGTGPAPEPTPAGEAGDSPLRGLTLAGGLNLRRSPRLLEGRGTHPGEGWPWRETMPSNTPSNAGVASFLYRPRRCRARPFVLHFFAEGAGYGRIVPWDERRMIWNVRRSGASQEQQVLNQGAARHPRLPPAAHSRPAEQPSVRWSPPISRSTPWIHHDLRGRSMLFTSLPLAPSHASRINATAVSTHRRVLRPAWLQVMGRWHRWEAGSAGPSAFVGACCDVLWPLPLSRAARGCHGRQRRSGVCGQARGWAWRYAVRRRSIETWV